MLLAVALGENAEVDVPAPTPLMGCALGCRVVHASNRGTHRCTCARTGSTPTRTPTTNARGSLRRARVTPTLQMCAVTTCAL